jgi:hypothetical protein
LYTVGIDALGPRVFFNLEWKAVTESNSTVHDPDTIGMLRRVLDDAWATLLPHQQTQANKSIMAQGLLKLAADGERDPTRLCELALLSVEERSSGAC